MWLLVWGVTPAAAALCLARGMEHAALLSALGNVAAAIAAVGCLAHFLGLLASKSWHGAELPHSSPASAWVVDDSETAGLSGSVPVPAAALASCASGFLIHFALPAVEASMTTPRRAMEATTRGYGVAAVVLLAFGLLGASATGPDPPRNALLTLGSGTGALLLRAAAALDALTTVPVLCRPALLVAESLWERATDTKLRAAGAAGVRCAFVAAAAAAAAAPTSGRFATMLPTFAGAAAIACALVLPPLLLLVGADADGAPLVRTSSLERTAAGAIVFLGVTCGVFASMAIAGAVVDVPYPYNAPPAPPALEEYDYFNTEPLFAFTGAPDVIATSDGGGGVTAGFGNGSTPASWAKSWNKTFFFQNSTSPAGSSDNASGGGGGGGGGGSGGGGGTGGGGMWQDGHWIMLPGGAGGAGGGSATGSGTDAAAAGGTSSGTGSGASGGASSDNGGAAAASAASGPAAGAAAA